MESDVVVQNMTRKDIEKFFIESYIRRREQRGKEYLYYKDIVCGCFDVYDSEEDRERDHNMLREILTDMVENGIFEKKGDTFKMKSDFV